MSIEHSAIADPHIHEPKGAAGAVSGAVYVANGSGSGTWINAKNLNRIVLTVRIPDISTADSVWVATPLAGKLIGVFVTLDAAITVANSNVSVEIAGVSVTPTSLVITQAASAPGSTFSMTVTANNTLTAGQVLEVITDGASTTASEAVVTLLIDVT